MATGLLIRVGMDYTYGGGHSPCNSCKDFVYLPIPGGKKSFCPEDEIGLGKSYDEFNTPLKDFFISNGKNNDSKILTGACHLDPDFCNLTYGDTEKKAQRIIQVFLENGKLENGKLEGSLKPNSFIAFYAAMKFIDDKDKSLNYALIGFYQIESIKLAKDIVSNERYKNAHTRYKDYRTIREKDDIVVFAKKNNQSGRLKKYITIGERRDLLDGRKDKIYRVKKDLLDNEWGGLSVKDGYIHRSLYLPEFQKPDKFLEWFGTPECIHENNPTQHNSC